MSTREQRGSGSRLDAWLDEYVESLLPWKRRAQAFYYQRRAERAERRGDLDAARGYYQRAVSQRGKLGDREAVIDLGTTLADVARENGDLGVARKHYERVVKLHARRENARGALDALEPLLDVLDEQGADSDLEQWWGHTMMVLGEAEPGEVSEQRRDELVDRYADEIYSEDSAGRLYGIALVRLLDGDEEGGAHLLDATWDRHDVVREQVDQFRVVLAAGVGRVAAAELSARDVDREATLEYVADYREKLSEPATALFDRLRDGETDVDPETLRTGVDPDDEAELRDIEAEVFGRFLAELS